MELIKENSPVALYHQLKSILAQKIMSNQWQAGDRLPTEHELCKQYGVSRITVRQALAELEGKASLSAGRAWEPSFRYPRLNSSLPAFTAFPKSSAKGA